MRYRDLLLRPWREADVGALRAAIDEDLSHLKPWLSWTLEEPVTEEETRARLRKWIEQCQSGQAFRYAIVPADQPSLILGGAHLKCRVEAAAHDLGYWVRRSAARQGIASAAASALIIHGFEKLQVDRLVIRCDRGNQASEAFARALDFRYVGEQEDRHADGSRRPVHQFELRIEDYRLNNAIPAARSWRRVFHGTPATSRWCPQ